MMRKVLSATLALAIAILLVVAGVTEPEQQAPRAEAAPLFQIEPAHAGFTPALDGSEPIFFLLLGDNYRKGIEESNLTDSVHIMGLNPGKQKGSLLGIPRDSWVNIPGHGQAKINEAYHFGGCKMAVATVEDLSGIQMDYCVVAGFIGFKALVTEVGGVTVNVPYDIEDSHVKFKFKKGKTHMSGKQALEFSRARYGVPNGDFSRSENQGIVLTSLLAQMQKQTNKDPSMMLRYISSTLRNIESDVPYEELLHLAFTAQQVPAKGVKNAVTPGGIAMKDGQSVVVLGSAAQKQFKKMRNDGIL